MTEYIIIVVVVALLTLVIVTRFGDQIRNLFISSGERLAGESSTSVENKMSGEEADRTIQDL
jgi:Flp pilus assembly pilin Flp